MRNEIYSLLFCDLQTTSSMKDCVSTCWFMHASFAYRDDLHLLLLLFLLPALTGSLTVRKRPSPQEKVCLLLSLFFSDPMGQIDRHEHRSVSSSKHVGTRPRNDIRLPVAKQHVLAASHNRPPRSSGGNSGKATVRSIVKPEHLYCYTCIFILEEIERAKEEEKERERGGEGKGERKRRRGRQEGVKKARQVQLRLLLKVFPSTCRKASSKSSNSSITSSSHAS